MFWRCFWKQIDVDVLQSAKHRANDASNDVNRPPLLSTRQERGKWGWSIFLQTMKWWRWCMMALMTLMSPITGTYMSVLVNIGTVQSSFRARKDAKQDLILLSNWYCSVFKACLRREIWEVCLNYSNWHFIARHPDSLNIERPYSKGWNSFEAHFDLCQNNIVCLFA